MILVETWQAFKKVAWFLPGFLLYAAYPPMGEMTDVLFALAPLMYFARRGNAKESAKRWMQSGIFFWIATLSWMPAIVKNGGPWPLVLLGWFALAAYCTLYFAAYGWLSATYWRWAFARSTKHEALFRILGILLVEPVLWCGLELIRSRFGGGFAWNHLGVVPANAGFGAPAALGGVYLLSAIVVLINGSIAGIIERVIDSRKGVRNRWRSLETLLVFVLVFALYSAARTSQTSQTSSNPPTSLRVALIQSNRPCCFQETRENPITVYSNLLESVSYVRPDLVVLPESAMSEFGALTSTRVRQVANWMRNLTGAEAIVSGGGWRDGAREYNAAAIFQDSVNLDSPGFQLYNKVHLVPFGEFIPGDKIFPALQRFAPVGSCTPGEPKVMFYKGLPFATAICYEDTDSALVREFAARGARFLCFVTNDGWFAESNETLSHAWQATARAIETGLPVLRVGNTGVTGVILPDGRRSYLVGSDGRVLVDESGVMVEKLSLPPSGSTPYTRYGDAPLAILFALLIGAMILVKYVNKFKRERILK